MVEGRRLVVNLAKYNIFGHKVEVATSINHLRSTPVGSGLPDLVSGFPHLHQNGGSNRHCLNALNGLWAKQRSVSIPINLCFLIAVRILLCWLGDRFQYSLQHPYFYCGYGFSWVGNKYLGGFVALLTFPNPNEACISWEDNNWSQECIGILVGHGRQLKEELELTWRDNSYWVWIIEEPGEWIPDCLQPITTPKDPYAKDCYRTQ
ncbi:hypothetical protein Hanom_Chr08g00698761 [Helianthus anomalus]